MTEIEGAAQRPVSMLGDTAHDIEIAAGWVARQPYAEPLAAAERLAAERRDAVSSWRFLAEAALRRRYPQLALDAWARCDDLSDIEIVGQALACIDVGALDAAVVFLDKVEGRAPVEHVRRFLLSVVNIRNGRFDVAYDLSKGIVETGLPASAIRSRGLAWLGGYFAAAFGRPDQCPQPYSAALASRWARPIDSGSSKPLFVLADARSLDYRSTSTRLEDYFDTVSLIRLLKTVGRSPDLAILEEHDADQAADPALRLYPIDLAVADRHLVSLSPVAKSDRPAWMVWSGDFSARTFGARTFTECPDNLNLLVAGLWISDPTDVAPDALPFLKPFEPIGCRDVRTTEWLLNQGVDAFPSGCLSDPTAPMAFSTVAETSPELRGLSFAAILRDAAQAHPPSAGMNGLALRVREVLAKIAEGAEPPVVRALWKALCREDVARAADELHAQHRYLLPRRAPRPLPSRRNARPAEVVVAICFDRKLAAHVRPLIRSIRANTKARLTVLALVRGLDDREARDAVGGDVDCRLVAMDAYLDGVPIHFFDGKTMSLMDRLFLPQAAPDLDKVVYLDIDILLQGDVADLAAIEPSHRGVAARPTPSVNWLTMAQTVERRARELSPSAAETFRRLAASSMDLSSPYFNSGVMVLSLERMRARDFVGKAVRLVEDVGLRDQDVLNLYAGGDYARLPAEWNSIPYSEVSDNAKIIHWAGRKKPWSDGAILLADRWRLHRDARTVTADER